MKTINPAPGKYDSNDGFGNLRSNGRRHTGIDFAVPTGTDFPAFASGVVTFSGKEPTGGNGFCLAWKLDGTELYAAYLHGLRVPPANVGDHIEVGQKGVFLSGNSGTNSQGPHVHLTLSGSDRAYQGYSPLYDPWTFIQEHLTDVASLTIQNIIERMEKDMTTFIAPTDGPYKGGTIAIHPGFKVVVLSGSEGKSYDGVSAADRNVGGVINAVWGPPTRLNGTDTNTVLGILDQFNAKRI